MQVFNTDFINSIAYDVLRRLPYIMTKLHYESSGLESTLSIGGGVLCVLYFVTHPRQLKGFRSGNFSLLTINQKQTIGMFSQTQSQTLETHN